ncbi:hypothetical protein [Kitasatospora sp. NPDC088548]|uniref:hypothetical protein n=1 Tax=Kitasatospora sp. NPDC088548 TaxID=3364075 RepID=UPI00381DF7E9
MHLALTENLIRELAAAPAERAATTCLLLGPDGWRIQPRPTDRSRDGLVAFDAEAVHDRLAAGDPLSSLLTPPQPGAPADWQVPGATGSRSTVRVVTGPAYEWAEAWAVDLALATVLSTDGSLLLTQMGRYLWSDPQGALTELTELEAAQAAYRARATFDDRLPPALLAARHARALVAALGLPADASVESAAALVETGKTVIKLLHGAVSTDVRTQRGIAAQRVVEHEGPDRGAHSRAAKRLGLTRPTLSELLSGR